MFSRKVTELPIDLINLNREQPRKVFAQAELAELASSIKEYGVLQPIIVNKTKGGEYFLIAGERRLRAAKQAGLVKIPSVIREADSRDIALIALIENVQRENLSYLEEAMAYKKLMEEHGLSQIEIAHRVGKQQSTISNKIRLLALPECICRQLIDNNLTERHARALLKLDSEGLCEKVLARVIAHGLNVKQTERLIEEILKKQEEEQRKAQKRNYIHYKIYVNTLKKTFEQIKSMESEARFFQKDLGDSCEVRILIPKSSDRNTGEMKPIVIGGIRD